MIKIKLSKAQKKKIREFLKTQDDIAKEEQENFFSDVIREDLTESGLLPYYANYIGFSYIITPTGLGTIIKIQHYWTKEILDITEYEKW